MDEQQPKSFKKSDFLTVSAAAKHFNISRETATKALKALYLRRATVAVERYDANGIVKASGRIGAVIPDRLHHYKDAYMLHPMAHELFKQELEKMGNNR